MGARETFIKLLSCLSSSDLVLFETYLQELLSVQEQDSCS